MVLLIENYMYANLNEIAIPNLCFLLQKYHKIKMNEQQDSLLIKQIYQ